VPNSFCDTAYLGDEHLEDQQITTFGSTGIFESIPFTFVLAPEKTAAAHIPRVPEIRQRSF
jgi:hypothetical protein